MTRITKLLIAGLTILLLAVMVEGYYIINMPCCKHHSAMASDRLNVATTSCPHGRPDKHKVEITRVDHGPIFVPCGCGCGRTQVECDMQPGCGSFIP